ncbi:hypothetical protein [Luteolibacter sp. Populi]|uniref:hypothetical protein n=1 Tax=Luteolibacter sp. Populi TaxID=3230487 RepID=UPI003465F543
MRRIVIIVMLLAASHGAALWLGAAQRVPVTAGEAAKAAGKADGGGLTLQALIEGSRQPEKAGEEEEDFDLRVQKAKDKIPADADLGALVRAGTVDMEAAMSPETVAAFGLWLDGDPVAALRFGGKFYRDHDYSEFDEELKRYLERGGLPKLHELMEAVPLAREQLINTASAALEDLSRAEALQVAGRLKSPTDRLELLKSVMDNGEDVKGNLSQIRGLLDKSGAAAFLQMLESDSEATGLLDEVRAAGFPEAALKSFEASIREREEEDSDSIGINRGNIDAIPGFLRGRTNSDFIEVLQIPGIPINRNNIDAILDGRGAARESLVGIAIPENEVVFAAATQGRMGSQEIYAALKANNSNGQAGERDMVRIALDLGIRKDPAATLEWLRGTGGDWQSLLAEVIPDKRRDIAPEVLAELVTDAWKGGSPPEETLDRLSHSYARWFEADGDACSASIRKLGDGALKTHLLEKFGMEATK